MRDLHNNIKASRNTAPAAIITGNGTTAGQIIDTVGFESLEFLIAAGVITDGTFTPTLTEGNDPALADGAAVAAADMLGSLAGATFVATTDNNAVKKIGYRGNKRYVRLSLAQTGATTGGFIESTAVQGHPRNAPAGSVVPSP